MRLGHTYAISLAGLTGTPVSVEAHVAQGLPSFQLVGLPDASLLESVARVRSASHNSGLQLPPARVTVNLSPASIPKHGTSFDLAIAVATLAATGQLKPEAATRWVHIGELGLDGSLRAISGVLPAVLAARRCGHKRVVVPALNQREAELVSGLEIFAANSLVQVAQLHGAKVASISYPTAAANPHRSNVVPAPELAEVRGQSEAVYALQLAAAGGHNLLLWGAPGCGKTMLAERLPGLLPALSLEQSIETTALHSVAGLTRGDNPLITAPPFEAPHHTISTAAMVGGGSGMIRPGAISRAHNGVLFLDEATEFQRTVMESLRQPMESGEVVIARANLTARFPARFQLVLAANPCPCGNLNSTKSCRCSSSALSRYASKLSGPLLDRVDIRLQLQATPAALLTANAGTAELTTVEARSRVEAARGAAGARLAEFGFTNNAQVPGALLRSKLRLSAATTRTLDRRLAHDQMTLRGYDRSLRLAWTIADLRGLSAPTRDEVDTADLFRGQQVLGVAA
jgi:magnesium chelatase family protein